MVLHNQGSRSDLHALLQGTQKKVNLQLYADSPRQVCATRLSGTGANDTRQFPPGTPILIDFEKIGVRISGSDGHSVAGLAIKKTIFLNSRQWPWFGPVSDMVCRAGKE